MRVDCGFKGHERNASIFIGFPLQMARNQVVAQAAHGFESHPVRQRKAGESNRFTGFYFICGYLISSHNSKSISLIYYPQRHPAYFCFQSRAAGSTFICQNRTPFIRHCSLTNGVRFTFTGGLQKRSGQTDFVYSFELVARKRYVFDCFYIIDDLRRL